MTDRPEELRADLISAVAERVREVEASAVADNPEAVSDLLDGGFEVADLGYEFAVPPVLEALDRLDDLGLVDSRQRGWRLNLGGRVALHGGRKEFANESFVHAQELGRSSGDRTLVASALLNRGVAAFNDGRRDEAVELFTKSNRARPPDDPVGRAQGWINLATAYLDTGEVERARRYVRRVERIPELGSYPSILSSAIGVDGLISARTGDLEKAHAAFRESARLAKKASALSHLLPALQNVGAVNLDLGRLGVATRWLRRAERLARLLLAEDVLEGTQRTLATALHRNKRSKEALTLLQSALEGAWARKDQASAARLNADIGAMAVADHDDDAAVNPLRSAFEQFVELREPQSALAVGRTLIDALVRSSLFAEAARSVDTTARALELRRLETLSLREHLGDELLEASQPSEAANVYRHIARQLRQGDPGSDEWSWRLGMKLRDANDPGSAVRLIGRGMRWLDPETSSLTRYQLLNDRALAYLALDKVDAAERDLALALTQATDVDDRVMQSILLSNLSETARRLGEPEEALEYANRAVQTSEAIGSDVEKARALTMLGLAAGAAGDWEAALSYHRRALELARNLGDQETESVALGGLAQANFAQDHKARAAELYSEAAAIERRLRDPDHEAQSRAALIELAAAANDEPGLRRELQRLINLVQQEHASLDIALNGISRAGAAWLRSDRIEAAGATYYAGILLALAQWDESSGGTRLVGKAMAAPYVHAAMINPGHSDTLDAYLRRRLKRRTKDAYSVVAELLTIARKGASRVSLEAPAGAI